MRFHYTATEDNAPYRQMRIRVKKTDDPSRPMVDIEDEAEEIAHARAKQALGTDEFTLILDDAR